eukprot:TRINITY_DN80444_c0_g1_i1.p1 TRINITY_DN80444_c0_g1~~TRINITY_DN80444_c0_g1_i1.p1  ORF type:complete len:358 (+),score=41.86 TRINITY_DN80444_c0_g1_i1:84-1076(+)
MGACQAAGGKEEVGGGLVTLHVYDVGNFGAVAAANELLRKLGTGAFHAAVEVYGEEWSFGYDKEGTGVFACPPKENDFHRYREAIEMGPTNLRPAEVKDLLLVMSKEWRANEYDPLRHNCCHFADEMCQSLGVGHIPMWVSNMAGAGAAVGNHLQEMPGNAQAVARAAGAYMATGATVAGAHGAQMAHLLALQVASHAGRLVGPAPAQQSISQSMVIPVQQHRSLVIPAPGQGCSIVMPAPTQNSIVVPATSPNSMFVPAPAQASMFVPAPVQTSIQKPAPVPADESLMFVPGIGFRSRLTTDMFNRSRAGSEVASRSRVRSIVSTLSGR